MLLALIALAGVANWIPARWHSHDPATLDLLTKYTPVNCILLEKSDWSAALSAAAKDRGIATLAVIHPGPDAVDEGRRAASMNLTGVVLEGDFPPATLAA